MNSNNKYSNLHKNDFNFDQIQSTSISNLIFSPRNMDYEENYISERNYFQGIPCLVNKFKITNELSVQISNKGNEEFKSSDKIPDYKNKVFDDFKFNWLKYNLLRKSDTSPSVKFNDLEYNIIKRVNEILKKGNLENKILLYNLMTNNDLSNQIMELLKFQKKLKEKKYNRFSTLFHIFLRKLANSDKETYRNLINSVLEDFSSFITKFDFDINKDSYIKEKKDKKSWLCPHTDHIHYARGKCQNCYLKSYYKSKYIKKKNFHLD